MELSKIQKKIVESKEPYILVNSCAGSGKTRCLVHRLQHLLNIGVAPSKIVAITFTNAAAEEILDRIARPTGLFVRFKKLECRMDSLYILSNSVS